MEKFSPGPTSRSGSWKDSKTGGGVRCTKKKKIKSILYLMLNEHF